MNPAIDIPAIVTAVAPVKFVPVITIPVAPDLALAGENPETVGGLPTVRAVAELIVNPAFVILIRPVRLPDAGKGIDI